MAKKIVKEPKRYQETKDYMNNFIVIEKGDPKLKNPLAFVLIRDSLVGETYKMFYNNADPELTKRLYMHEAGHIIYDHIENSEMKAASVSSRIRAKYDQCKDRFSSPEKFFEYFKRVIFNQIMDFEVNSKLFSWKEFLEFEKMTSKLLGEKVMACHPARYGYPSGKTWKEYLTYVLNDLDRFIDNKQEEMRQQQMQNDQQQNGQGDQEDEQQNDQNQNGQNDDEQQNEEKQDMSGSEGAGSQEKKQKSESGKGGKNDENKSDESGDDEKDEEQKGGANESNDQNEENGGTQGDGEDDAMSPSTDQELRKRSANQDIRNGERPKFTPEQEAELAKAVKDELGDSLEKKAENIESRSDKCSENWGRGGAAKEFDLTPCTFDEIKRELLDKVFSRKLLQTRRDMMYNVNRRKIGGGNNLIIPRDTNRTEFRADDFVVILDVSGSVSASLINKTLNVFGDLSNRFGKKSRIIFWADGLHADLPLKEVTHGYSGGGTNIAAGIDYVNEKGYVKGGTKLFIISDFCDYLKDWKNSLDKLPSREVYGICWEDGADLKIVANNFKNIYYLKEF